MELGTSLKDPQTLELQDPGKWDENIKLSLRDTALWKWKNFARYVISPSSTQLG